MRPLTPLITAGLLALLGGCTSHSAGPGEEPALPVVPSGSASSGTLRIGMMPKQKGIPYFNACQKGAEEAARELRDVELVFDGPTEDRSEAQSTMLDSWILRKFDALAVACNDPDQIAPTLSRARDAGITVVTYDADANPETSRRQFFVNQVDAEEISKALVDEMAKQAGEDAEVGVVSSSSTAPNQSAWLEQMEQYRAEKYPRMRIVTTEYAGENQVKSFQLAQNILKAYPNVRGIWGMTSVAFPGAAQAVERAGKTGQVAVVGLGTPNVMKEFVERGVVRSVVLWNPVDLGYLTVHAARAAAKGELKPDDTTLAAGRLGELKVRDRVVLLGKPMIFTKENIGEFDF